eukprot:Em0008g348a
MVSTKQNWSDIAVSKNAILNLMKKVEEKKTEFAKKELEPQPVKSVQSKSTESSTEANSGIFCDGFLNKGSEDSGFPFLAAQENSATESFFCESARASTLPESNTGFGLSYPFMLQSSETPATSMFTF